MRPGRKVKTVLTLKMRQKFATMIPKVTCTKTPEEEYKITG